LSLTSSGPLSAFTSPGRNKHSRSFGI